ncbi:RimJ/RimL family protein N-acetyltransferase [Labedella gwakjiensis]|uniref:N-acetyltransferase n=1 Tax=Labedella gwakjiensis TaxID=390269 RepID=A0A2P8GXN3_9MICO|nr:GNAT family protein [Labedella gwakjiensis]PSL38730.1 RimJ/RimL family protein N-acetyltransferase [Labedella gwakjiensis]RUQ86782.1 N-acetyltransferase [Labedella gwakjiensis]
MTAPIELRTARLVLSIPTGDDVDDITSACQDESVQRWTTVPSPYSRRDAETFVRDFVTAGWETGKTRTWAIRLASELDGDGRSATLVGMIGLEGIEDGAAEIGYWLAPVARGAGIMSEAVAAVIDHAFAADGVGLQRVQWRAYRGNRPSARVAHGAGLRFEGTRRLGAVGRSGREDEWTAAILNTDERSSAPGWPAEAVGG